MRSLITSLKLDLLSVIGVPPFLGGLFGMSVREVTKTFMPLLAHDCLQWLRKSSDFPFFGLSQLHGSTRLVNVFEQHVS